ncbi:hypothetical protein ACFLRC_02920, partial [Candidatus Altiarchaeota archaeon]
DCGGLCPACLSALEGPTITIVSPRSQVYTQLWIELDYSVDKKVEGCEYSLNNGRNYSAAWKTRIPVPEGQNNLTVYCIDVNDNLGSKTVGFTVSPLPSLETMVCGLDKASFHYSGHWEGINIFSDDHRFVETRGVCNRSIFEQITTREDSDSHSDGPLDVSGALRDQELLPVDSLNLRYDCRTSGSIEASYLHLHSPVNPVLLSNLNAVFYFSESKPVGRSNSFWRFYAYSGDMDSVTGESYVDVEYNPVASECSAENETVFFQEIDLNPFIPLLMENNLSSIDVRLAFYTSTIETTLELMEAELYWR